MNKNETTTKKAVATAMGRDFKKLIKVDTENLGPIGENEVFIRNKYAGVNASDLNLMAGAYFADAKPPLDLGFEFCGEIIATGEKVNGFAVGDQVMGIALGQGYREISRLQADAVIPVPECRPESMTLITSGLAASIGLEKVGEIKSSDKVLVTAAAGAVGSIAVQLAKRLGCHVIGTCSSDEKLEELKRLGCSRVINYNKESIDDVLQQEYPEGIDLVFENVGGELFDITTKHLAKLGRLVICGFISEYESDEPAKVLSERIYHRLLWKSASVRAFLFSDFPELIPEHLQRLFGLLASGELEVKIDEKVFKGVGEVPNALAWMYARKNIGKVVITFN
ncbi:MAG: zinc-binding dehydrogenase [Cyclobacteriaceae bacterium]|nr:zinc-binding dehydrogenase [Cyclobacteriaceae bacterium]MCH8517076.1 zinc-binding dehydrogenase [Cyclobacteriaceae bacterium]